MNESSVPKVPKTGPESTIDGKQGELSSGELHWHRRRTDHSVDEWLVGAELDASLQSLLASLSESVGAALTSQLGKM